MDTFECTLVLNPSLVPAPAEPLFWPVGRSRLVLLFEILTDKIIVRGIDPDVAEQCVLVFYADLAPDQKDRFVQAVQNGLEPTLLPPSLVSNENRGAGAPALSARKPASSLAGKAFAAELHSDAIVITDPPGKGQGPKVFVLELPSSGAARATGTQG